MPIRHSTRSSFPSPFNTKHPGAEVGDSPITLAPWSVAALPGPRLMPPASRLVAPDPVDARVRVAYIACPQSCAIELEWVIAEPHGDLDRPGMVTNERGIHVLLGVVVPAIDGGAEFFRPL